MSCGRCLYSLMPVIVGFFQLLVYVIVFLIYPYPLCNTHAHAQQLLGHYSFFYKKYQSVNM